MGLHPSEILTGYEKGAKKVLELLETLSCYKIESIRDRPSLQKCIRSAIASKQYGLEDFLSGLIAESCLYAMPKDERKFNVDNIRVQKILGGSIHDSQVVHGMVIMRGVETSIIKVVNARIAVFNTSIEMQ
jgi:T-complex protein 1 subunit theta